MELRQLKYFAAVCETLHYGKAAENCILQSSPLASKSRSWRKNWAINSLNVRQDLSVSRLPAVPF